MSRDQMNFLVDSTIKTARGKDKDYRLNDGGNLYVLVKPSGSRLWRMKYTVNGRTKLASLGKYPIVTLARARELRQDVASLAKQGIDWTEQKRARKQAQKNTFKAVAEDWLKIKEDGWTAEHDKIVRRSLERDVYPMLGNKPVSEITSKMVLDTASRIAKQRGAHVTAKRVLWRISSVLSYAAFNGLVAVNPAIGAIEHLPAHKNKPKPFPAIEWKELPTFVQTLNQSELPEQTKLALQLLLLTFVRSNELRCATWDEFDFEERRWRIPGARMKMDREHVVPLSDQAIDVLERLRPYSGDSDYILPGYNGKPLHANALLLACHNLGYKGRLSPHGFRKVASSWLNEQGKFMYEGQFPDGKTYRKLENFSTDAIERQLAHGSISTVRDIYNIADYMGERTTMMQVWADHLDACADTSGKVVSLCETA